MASNLLISTPKLIKQQCSDAVKYYIKQCNIAENREPYHGFPSTYISNISAYVQYVETNSTYNKSLLSLLQSSTYYKDINFACVESIEDFLSS